MLNRSLAIKITLVFAVLGLTAQTPSYAKDRDNNPPGPKGGAGTNWENPAGPQGGPGASPNQHHPKHHYKDRDNNPPGPKGGPGSNWEKNDYPKGWTEGKKEGWNGESVPPKHKPNIDFNGDGVVDETEKKTAYDKYIAPNKEKRAEWKEKKAEWKENHPKPDHKPHFDRDNNPPGPKGGAGTNWENPAGPKGGPGASPNPKPKKD